MVAQKRSRSSDDSSARKANPWLKPGDLLFTGTPPGVGVYREPPVLLEDGDEVTVGIEGIGELTNECRYG